MNGKFSFEEVSASSVMFVHSLVGSEKFVLWAKPIILFICSCSQCVCGCVALPELRLPRKTSCCALATLSERFLPPDRKAPKRLMNIYGLKFLNATTLCVFQSQYRCNEAARVAHVRDANHHAYELQPLKELQSQHISDFSGALNFDTTQFSC